MQEVIKSMNKEQIALMFGWSVQTLVKWMRLDCDLQKIVIKKNTGTYLYTEAEIQLIIKKYKEGR